MFLAREAYMGLWRENMQCDGIPNLATTNTNGMRNAVKDIDEMMGSLRPAVKEAARRADWRRLTGGATAAVTERKRVAKVLGFVARHAPMAHVPEFKTAESLRTACEHNAGGVPYWTGPGRRKAFAKWQEAVAAALDAGVDLFDLALALVVEVAEVEAIEGVRGPPRVNRALWDREPAATGPTVAASATATQGTPASATGEVGLDGEAAVLG
jgi:hypothetical protein